MPTTEIATLTLKPGSDIGDPNNDASRIVNECGNILMQQPGIQALRFGPVIEDPSKMQMFIDWDDKQKHEDFIASDTYPGFLEKFRPLMAAPPSFMHIDFEGDLPGALKASATEVLTLYFQDRTPDDYTKVVHDFIRACQEESPDTKIRGYATGTTHEVIEQDGVKGKGGVLVVGWDSVEQHMELRNTEFFQKNASTIRQGAGAIQMHHASSRSRTGLSSSTYGRELLEHRQCDVESKSLQRSSAVEVLSDTYQALQESLLHEDDGNDALVVAEKQASEGGKSGEDKDSAIAEEATKAELAVHGAIIPDGAIDVHCWALELVAWHGSERRARFPRS